MGIFILYIVVTSAVIVNAGSWSSFPTMLRPAVTENELHFGVTLALDENYLVIGTNMDDENGLVDIGTVSIFTRVSGEWDLMETLIPSNGEAYDKFGSDVSIYNGTIIVGTTKGNTSIYRYNDSWSEVEEKNEVNCGYSVEIYGDYAVNGCPSIDSVSIYKLDTSTNLYFSSAPQILTSTSGTFFGDSLTMYGSYLAVSSTDVVRVYELSQDGSQWDIHTNISISPNLRTDGAYGRTISMYGDRLVISSNSTGPDTSSIDIYKKGNTNWTLEAQFSDTYRSASVSIYNDSIIVGFYDYSGVGTVAGSVKIYKLTDGVWQLFNNLVEPDVVNGDMFGRSVAVWDNIFVSGAPYDDNDGQIDKGAVYIFDSTAVITDVIVSNQFVFTMTLGLYESTSFVTKLEGPLEVGYGEYIHVGIKETHQSPLFKFIVNACYATPSSNSSEETQYLFFENKCSNDDTFSIIQSTTDTFSFNLMAFGFTATPGTEIYIHCQVLICLSDDASSSCSQTCDSKRRRRSVGDDSKIVAGLVLASNKITLRPPPCSHKTCPSHSTCFDFHQATCICNAGYVFSTSSNECTDQRILRIEGMRLNVPWLDTYHDENSIDSKRITYETSRKLNILLQKHGADEVINGVKLVSMRKGDVDIVVDVLVTVSKITTPRAANDIFLTCIKLDASEESSLRPGLSVKMDAMPGFTFQSKKRQTYKKKVLSIFAYLVFGVLFVLLVIIAGTAYTVKLKRSKCEPKKESELGTDNDAVETSHESEKNY